jgi:hypothetical protein
MISLFEASNNNQDASLTHEEKDIYKLQHQINLLNCKNKDEQKKYLQEKMVTNQGNYEEFVNNVLMPTLCFKQTKLGGMKKRNTPFLADKLEVLKQMITGEYQTRQFLSTQGQQKPVQMQPTKSNQSRIDKLMNKQ